MKVENNILMIQCVILSEERAKLYLSKIRGGSQEAKTVSRYLQCLFFQYLNYPILKFHSEWKLGQY